MQEVTAEGMVLEVAVKVVEVGAKAVVVLAAVVKVVATRVVAARVMEDRMVVLTVSVVMAAGVMAEATMVGAMVMVEGGSLAVHMETMMGVAALVMACKEAYVVEVLKAVVQVAVSGWVMAAAAMVVDVVEALVEVVAAVMVKEVVVVLVGEATVQEAVAVEACTGMWWAQTGVQTVLTGVMAKVAMQAKVAVPVVRLAGTMMYRNGAPLLFAPHLLSLHTGSHSLHVGL